MNAETKAKISAAQKGKRTGPRGPHGAAVTILDFDVEVVADGRVRVEVFNDVGGRSLADFAISPIKAERLGRALLAAAGATEKEA